MSEQRYRVIQRLEAGGMAEVFVGEAVSVQGFKKKVAIKRVLPHLAQNAGFIGMFLDEARLGARLNHANIVSVFDIGAADDTFFIVMEFIDGCNLKKIMEVLRRQGRSFPVKESISICMEACKGLSYAHELEDEDGAPMHLVHRDVSPPNILVSKRGEVKVTDFGLAKASTQLEKTDPGVVKGKFSYLSPEAALGEPVDERADVFALAIVLWEMLAGRRLFLGETDFQTVRLVQEANIPSISRIRPEVGGEFEQILAKGLARIPDDRYQSARDFEDALAGYLFGNQMKVTSHNIAKLVKDTLADKDPGTATATKQQSMIDRLIQEELFRFTSLDDLEEALVIGGGGQQISPDSVAAGATPLDAGLFENPADWFSGDEAVQDALAYATTESEPGWRESGIEGLVDDVPKGPELGAAPLTGLASKPLQEEHDLPSAESKTIIAAVPDEDTTSGGAGKWIFLLLVAVAGAAAAYFVSQQ